MIFSGSHRHVQECASTNDLAREWARDPNNPAPHGAWVSADFQTRGRGRRGRTWDAAPGVSVLMSVVLRPGWPQSEAWQIGFVASLAAADALEGLGLVPRLKWPNDVLLGEGKAVGVLVETLSLPAQCWAAIVGIGVNVNQTAFPPGGEYLHLPTSLRLATGNALAVSAVAEAVLAALEQRTEQHAAQGFVPIAAEWRARMAMGAALRRGREQAILEDISEDGSAHVRLPDGTLARWATVEA